MSLYDHNICSSIYIDKQQYTEYSINFYQNRAGKSIKQIIDFELPNYYYRNKKYLIGTSNMHCMLLYFVYQLRLEKKQKKTQKTKKKKKQAIYW